MTLVYQIDSGRKRLLGVIRDRNTRSLASFFESFGAERCAGIKVVCSDMWKPYLNVIAAMLPAALNVLDQFHIARQATNPFSRMPGIVFSSGRPISLSGRQIPLYHTLGALPEPKFTHRFC